METNKRTSVDFSKYELTIQENELVTIHWLKKKDTICGNVKFINCDGRLMVTGDYGNWIFCRSFMPSKDGFVSENYWVEKLTIHSMQNPNEFDHDKTEKELRYQIEKGLEDYGYEGDELEKIKEFYTELLEYVYDEIEYNYKAFRDNPSFVELELIPFCTKLNNRLLIVFDAFEEICKRMNEKNK